MQSSILPEEAIVLVSGGAGYIGSHVVHCLKAAGFSPVVVDSLVNGHRWAVHCPFHQGNIADTALIRDVCAKYKPVAALHFAAFIEVGESVTNPEKYFSNNRDNALSFFETLAAEGVNKIVFSSTAAVYGDPTGNLPLTEADPTCPMNPYGQSKLAAESYLQAMGQVRSVILRYFNVAGSAAEVGLGEAHFPETHLIPRIVLPLIDTSELLLKVLGLSQGFKIYGEDHATRDGTAVRDYLHVLDLADAHVRALRYLLDDGDSNIFNLGSGVGYSVREIVRACRDTLDRPDFCPEVCSRRAGDPAMLVASSEKAQKVLRWKPNFEISDMIRSAASWHGSDFYRDAILKKRGLLLIA
jgi:UDP-glucose 4-epimerase